MNKINLHNKLVLCIVYALTFFVILSIDSCGEDEGYCFTCRDEFETETFCYEDYKNDYSKAEFKEMVFNLEAFGFTCKRD